MMVLSARNEKVIETMARLDAEEGVFVPHSLEDFLNIYGNRFSDERQIEKREKVNGGDGSDALHMDVAVYADRWMTERSMVKELMGQDLGNTDFPWQLELISQAWSIHDKRIRDRWKKMDLREMKPEAMDEKTRWKSLIPERFKDASMADFPPQTKSYMDHIFGGGSMLMLGGTGVGKSHFLWAVAKAIVVDAGMEPGMVKVINLQELLAKVRTSGADWVEEAIRLYGTVTWLLVDECDKTDGKESDYLIINAIVNKRYENGYGTVFVGNGTREQMAKKLGEPVVSRLTAGNEKGMLFMVDGADRRNKR